MGLLIDGKWQDSWYDTEAHGGEFRREAARLRNWITADGEPGPTGEGGFSAESGRYHLYVSYACPWAHRTLIFRRLKQLEDHVAVSVVSPLMLAKGWSFKEEEGSTGDALHNFKYLHQLYTLHNTTYSGRVTVPVLWDKQLQRIVNNESSEIIRMFNSAFNHITGDTQDFYPQSLQSVVDDINTLVYNDINNGVYRCGFATRQAAYEQAYHQLFNALDTVEELLSRQRYLAGPQITEADWRLFTTLIRFDSVYHGHFKCNRQRLEDFPNLSNYTRDLFQWPDVAATVHFDHIKRHYYYSHHMINPNRVVPVGPQIDYYSAHDRGRFA